MPPTIKSNGLTYSTDLCNQNAPSSVTQRLLANALCINAYNSITILEVSNRELQLSVLEVLYITKYQPTLCKQKEFYNLLIFNPTNYIAIKSDLVKKKQKNKSLRVNIFFFSFFLT